jgi:hypothetical protein
MEVEILFYRNCAGAVAISLDEGETVWTPAGRNIPLVPAWEWTDEDGLESLLTSPQVKALDDSRKAPPLTEIEELTRVFHKRQMAVKKDFYQAPPPPRKVRESVLVVTSDPDD